MLRNRLLIIFLLLFGLLMFTQCGNPRYQQAKSYLKKAGYKLTEEGFYKAVDAEDLETVLAYRDYFHWCKNPFDIINNGFLYACETGNLIIAKGLIEHSKAERPDGKGPQLSWILPQSLELAFQSENEDLIQYLIDDMHAFFIENKKLIQKYDADRYIAGPYPKILPLAVIRGDMDILKKLLDKNALIGLDSLNENIRQSITKLGQMGLKNGEDTDEGSLLNDYGAFIQLNQSIQGSICADFDRALCFAAARGNLEMVKVLLNHAGKYYSSICGEILDDEFKTPLMHAVSLDFKHYLEKYSTVEYLIDYLYQSYGNNKFINAQNRNGETALLIATLSALNDPDPPENNTQVIQLLLDHNANAYLKDKTGKSALDHALELKDCPSSKAIVNLLTRWSRMNPESKFIEDTEDKTIDLNEK